ncbi:LOW QUALITY PROTEIN: hypothetical protein MXB_5178 [Myxobolus squamalis]|nr:LOW QUALITY PROTEIN: hypothetical protein MXB_5178 [Myxobolus squamalis]
MNETGTMNYYKTQWMAQNMGQEFLLLMINGISDTKTDEKESKFNTKLIKIPAKFMKKLQVIDVSVIKSFKSHL